MRERVKEWITGSILLAIIAVLAFGAHARNFLWENEIDLWKDCVKKAPLKERPHHNLGYAYYEAGQWEEAQGEFERALALNPHYTLSTYNLGLVFYRRGMMREAIDCYRKALGLKDPPPETYFNLGLAYHQKGLYPDAVDAFQALLKIKPDYENGYNNLGLAYQRSKRWDPAIRCFQEELRRNPENPYTHLYLGDLYYELKNNPKALIHLKKALTYPHLSGAERAQRIVLSIEGASKSNRGREKRGARST